ncbi:hypothetical protein K08M3_50620 [Vibrio alginolyticus]|uniref:Uncharacterized protein n=1 Tax=Vibrio alginolyticus TaxID=663 RepID=A0A1W6UV67_VIBAL|nr:hypothetical protein [Vibrio alginolyticus]ARP06572.1 hypothetical protein K04M1_50490 [Vibrio alginolyticus]ARP11705.1 hypothetical protein K04M3_51360 [Vibrio alginolyticus]ARP16758.1 hypothetical protein K04M5_51060 [Vibrio alginolyticus]ARP21795.1 hypothetical protein K05K4_50930 [Vibrio alginolyticus]ARP26858.1 hypothetical protein K06K5_50580 [Vibrio alginolyticus]
MSDYKIEYQPDGTANTEWQSDSCKLRVRWMNDDVQKLFFRLKTDEASSSTVLSIKGIRVVECQGKLRFFNSDKQFMQDIWIPKSFGMFLCEHHNIQVESEEVEAVRNLVKRARKDDFNVIKYR